MRCVRANSLITARQARRLDPRRQGALSRHLDTCEACRRAESLQRSLDGLFDSLARPEAHPEATLQRLRHRIGQQRIPSTPQPLLARRLFPVLLRQVPAALFVAAGLAIGALLGSQLLPRKSLTEISMEQAFPTLSILDQMNRFTAAIPSGEAER